jgi:hypothetical protein
MKLPTGKGERQNLGSCSDADVGSTSSHHSELHDVKKEEKKRNLHDSFAAKGLGFTYCACVEEAVGPSRYQKSGIEW